MAYRVVDKYVGGKGTDADNPTDDAAYEIQTNVADFVHHILMQGQPYTIEDGQGYGCIDGLSGNSSHNPDYRGNPVATACPVSWSARRNVSPAAAMWNEWKTVMQTDKDNMVEVFDADTQTYTRTVDWDSEGNWKKYCEINALMMGMEYNTTDIDNGGNDFQKATDNATARTESPRNSVDSDLDQWRINNMNTRRHYKVNVSKGNV